MPIDPTDRWYLAEVTPPNLAALNAKLRSHYNLGPMYIGSKGDLRHQRGYHRSRAFIENSPYCTNRTYSVGAAVNQGGDDNWLSAIDMTLPKAELLAVCRRLDAAARAGRIEQVTEWYGNTNDDARVDGWDNISNVVSTSDSSHLWHVHLSLARSKANDNHDDLFQVITGGDDMPTAEEIAKAVWSYPIASRHLDNSLPHSAHEVVVNAIQTGRAVKALAQQQGIQYAALMDQVDELEEIAAAGSDPDALAAAISERLAPAQQQALMAALQRIRITVDE
jgi:hypothetical protein